MSNTPHPTVLTELIKYYQQVLDSLPDDLSHHPKDVVLAATTTLSECIVRAKARLPREREQIEGAYRHGFNHGFYNKDEVYNGVIVQTSASDYFTQNYVQE